MVHDMVFSEPVYVAEFVRIQQLRVAVVFQFGRMWSGHSVTGLLERPIMLVFAAATMSGHGVTGPQTETLPASR